MEGILEKGEIACVAHQNISMTNGKKARNSIYTLEKMLLLKMTMEKMIGVINLILHCH